MDSLSVVIELNVSNDRTAGVLKIQMSDVRQFNLKRMPETLDRLIVVWRTRTRHAFQKTVFFDHAFRLLCRVLATSVAVIDRTLRDGRVSSDCHQECVLYKPLGLGFVDRPSDKTPRCNIDHSTQIQVRALVFQDRNIRTPQHIRLCYRELILDQVFFNVLLFCGLGRFLSAASAAFCFKAIHLQNSTDFVFTDPNSFRKQRFPDPDSSVSPLVFFKTVNHCFFKLDFFTVRLFFITVIVAP